MKLFSQFNWKRIIDGEEFPFPASPQKKADVKSAKE